MYSVVNAVSGAGVRNCRMLVAALAGLALLVGCAPDSINNRAATGFDAYINTLKTCKPFVLGSVDLAVLIDYNAMGDDNYQNFMDQTSKLYYHRISFDLYRQSLKGFFGDGPQNQATFDCIQSHLPADRPMGPPGSVISY